jgi:hypothetical protein
MKYLDLSPEVADRCIAMLCLCGALVAVILSLTQ